MQPDFPPAPHWFGGSLEYPNFKFNWNIFGPQGCIIPMENVISKSAKFKTVKMRSQTPVAGLLSIKVRETTYTFTLLSQELCVMVMVGKAAYLKPILQLRCSSFQESWLPNWHHN